MFRNKLDENSIIVKNKVRLVAQEFDEVIDFDEILQPLL